MTHAQGEDGSIVLHQSRMYDLAFGWAIRRSDWAIMERADVAPGDRVLDVGTGPGYLALAASRLVGSRGAAVGIDASPEIIERARQLASRKGATVEYQVATAASLPFEDGSFDAVINRLVLHHLPGELKTQALAEMLRVLRPGGRLLVADMASKAARGSHHLTAHVLGTDPQPDDGLQRVVWDAGFRDVTYGPLLHGFLIGVAGRRPESQG
jgi:ubiquinone/menaquinone biosynthesis C-methylase UbiE